MDSDAINALTEISGSNIQKQLFWISLFLFYLWRIIAKPLLTKDKATYLFYLLILCSIALLSSIWSDAVSFTFKRSIFQFIFCCTVVTSFYYALMHETLSASLRSAGILILVMTLITIILGVAFSPNSLLAGFANSKNTFAQGLLAFLILYISYLKVSNLPFLGHKLIIGLIVFCLMLTGSKTSITLFVIFLILGFTHKNIIKPIVAVSFSFLFFIFIVLPVMSHFLGAYTHIGQWVDDSFITGRGYIWDTLYYDIDYFSKYHFGYGYGAYFAAGEIPWFFDYKWSFLKHIASSHNAYLDILLQFGIWGSLAIYITLILMGKKLNHAWLLSGVFALVLYNFTESAFFKDQTMLWFLFVTLFAMNSALPRIEKKALYES